MTKNTLMDNKCAVCGGSGMDPDNAFEFCDSCNGTGLAGEPIKGAIAIIIYTLFVVVAIIGVIVYRLLEHIT